LNEPAPVMAHREYAETRAQTPQIHKRQAMVPLACLALAFGTTPAEAPQRRPAALFQRREFHGLDRPRCRVRRLMRDMGLSVTLTDTVQIPATESGFGIREPLEPRIPTVGATPPYWTCSNGPARLSKLAVFST
jgi:hypothetical protein